MKILKIFVYTTFFSLLCLLFINNYRYKASYTNGLRQREVLEEMVILHSNLGGSFNLSSETIFLDSLGNTILLKDLVKDYPKLVFRFTSLNCDKCYKEVLSVIAKQSKKHNDCDLLLIVSFNHINNLRLILRDYNLRVPFFFTTSASLINELDSINFPYFFTLGQDGKVSNMFFVNSETPELTNHYLTTITNYFK